MSDTPAIDRLDAVGEDEIMSLVADGHTIGKLGKRYGVSRRSFYNWINAEKGRRKRLEEAKALAAESYVDDADETLSKATPENIQVAKEQANHLKWKAAKLDRDTWGDKPTQVNIGLNVGDLHLDALRLFGNMEQAKLNPPTIEAEVIEDAETTEA